MDWTIITSAVASEVQLCMNELKHGVSSKNCTVMCTLNAVDMSRLQVTALDVNKLTLWH